MSWLLTRGRVVSIVQEKAFVENTVYYLTSFLLKRHRYVTQVWCLFLDMHIYYSSPNVLLTSWQAHFPLATGYQDHVYA